MGYYTTYSLRIIETTEENNWEIIPKFRKEYDSAKYAINDMGDALGETKWYDSTIDLINFSEKHPTILFCLDGTGEESEDIWRLYVKNGKSQYIKAELVFEEFNEEKLQ